MFSFIPLLSSIQYMDNLLTKLSYLVFKCFSLLLNLLWFLYLFIIIIHKYFFFTRNFPFYYKLVNCKVTSFLCLMKFIYLSIICMIILICTHIIHSTKTICRVILYHNKTLEQKKRSIKKYCETFSPSIVLQNPIENFFGSICGEHKMFFFPWNRKFI